MSDLMMACCCFEQPEPCEFDCREEGGGDGDEKSIGVSLGCRSDRYYYREIPEDCTVAGGYRIENDSRYMFIEANFRMLCKQNTSYGTDGYPNNDLPYPHHEITINYGRNYLSAGVQTNKSCVDTCNDPQDSSYPDENRFRTQNFINESVQVYTGNPDEVQYFRAQTRNVKGQFIQTGEGWNDRIRECYGLEALGEPEEDIWYRVTTVGIRFSPAITSKITYFAGELNCDTTDPETLTDDTHLCGQVNLLDIRRLGVNCDGDRLGPKTHIQYKWEANDDADAPFPCFTLLPARGPHCCTDFPIANCSDHVIMNEEPPTVEFYDLREYSGFDCRDVFGNPHPSDCPGYGAGSYVNRDEVIIFRASGGITSFG